MYSKQTKSNQFTIARSELHRVKTIQAIKIDAVKRSISTVVIEDCIEYLQMNFDFHAYREIIVNECECLIIGVDEDLKINSSYRIRGLKDSFYGHAAVVRVPASGNLHKLKSTKLTIMEIEKLIDFDVEQSGE